MAVSPERRTRTMRGKPAEWRSNRCARGRNRQPSTPAVRSARAGRQRVRVQSSRRASRRPMPAVRRLRSLDKAAGKNQPQVIGAKREAGQPLEDLGHAGVFQDAMLARQHQGRAFVASGETKNGAPKGATASSLTAPPASRPVRMRPRTRSPPRGRTRTARPRSIESLCTPQSP